MVYIFKSKLTYYITNYILFNLLGKRTVSQEKKIGVPLFFLYTSNNDNNINFKSIYKRSFV